MGHEASSRGGQQRGSAMGAHYRHTTPEMAARIATAVEQRLRVVLEVAEQTLESHPNRSTQRVFWRTRTAFSGESLAMALRAGVRDVLCLVELRGFEPLTPCMPLTSQPLAPQHASTRCLRSVLLSAQIATKRRGAGCGDVRLGCWQIAGSLARRISTIFPRSAHAAPSGRPRPCRAWLGDLPPLAGLWVTARRRHGPGWRVADPVHALLEDERQVLTRPSTCVPCPCPRQGSRS
jgi:hypothetical protein